MSDAVNSKLDVTQIFAEAADREVTVRIPIGQAALVTDADKVIPLKMRHDTYGNASFVDAGRIFAEHHIGVLDAGVVNTAVVESKLTFIDGDKGKLLHLGVAIEDIVAGGGTHLELACALWDEKFPTTERLAEFKKTISRKMQVDQAVVKSIGSFNYRAHPMKLLKLMITAASIADDKKYEDIGLSPARLEEERGLDLIAQLPMMVALAHRHKRGLPPVYPKKELGYTENFLRMCFAENNGDNYTQNPQLVKAMDVAFMLHADHEQNLSTSMARFITSGKADIYAAMTAATDALSGAAHGGANEKVLQMLEAINAEEGDLDTKISRVIADAKRPKGDDKKRVLEGFGHRVYKNYDPRAKIMQKLCRDVLTATGKQEDPLLQIAMRLEKAALEDPYFVDKKLYPNVDFYSGIIYKALGFSSDEFTAIFDLARMAGWVAQRREMMQESNGSAQLTRPRQLYKGNGPTAYVPIAYRGAPSKAPAKSGWRRLFEKIC